MFAANGNSHLPAGTGLLLVGHGSREPAGVAEFLETARRVAARVGQAPVEPCFLEFARPTIAEGFAALVRRGARRVVVAPVLLFAAGHAKRDIPAAVAVAAASAVTDVVQSDHLGCHASIVELSAARYDEVIQRAAVADEADTVLVLVGRGSRDDEATAEMHRFVELRARAAGVPRARVCFVAMAEPRLGDVLDEVATSGARRVLVQPHLLFGGVLVDRIGQTVADYAACYPQICWLTSGHLGPSELVATAALERVSQRLASQRHR